LRSFGKKMRLPPAEMRSGLMSAPVVRTAGTTVSRDLADMHLDIVITTMERLCENEEEVKHLRY
jgi:tryptophanase